MKYQVVQTFYLDPNAVNNSSLINLVDVSLYFRQVPNANNNASGMPAPGVTIAICQTTGNNVPDVTKIVADSTVFLQYTNINTSSDANTATVFPFDSPIPIKTGKFYGVAIHFDSPEFVLWYNKQGDTLLGTNNISPGPSGKFHGGYWQLGNDGTLTQKADFNLKFSVEAAQYTSNTATIELIPDNYEFINYDSISNTMNGGELVYQDFGGYTNGALSANVTFYGNGTINVASNTNLIMGTGTTFTNAITGFANNGESNCYIVVSDGTAGNTEILAVIGVVNDTILYTDEPPTFTNTTANYKKTAVGRLFDVYYQNTTLMLYGSTSNTQVQFSNSSIKTFTIVAGGSGYSNTDYILVSGGNASINATANVTTNSTGGIVSLNIVNAGFGFVNTGVLSILAANGSASNGTTANVAAMVGATLRGVTSQAYCNLVSFFDFNVDFFTPEILVKAPDTAIVNLFADFANSGHVVNASLEEAITIDVPHYETFDARILSTATEVNTANSNLANIDGVYKSAYVRVEMTANQSNVNLFTAPHIYSEKLDIITFQNQINNDISNEVTSDNGNCTSKALMEPFTFGNNGLAEAMRVYIDIYNPLNTNVYVYARMINFNDSDPFTSKSWTPLTITNGAGVISSSTDREDFHEVTFEIPYYPASLYTLPGNITITTGNNVLLTTSDTSANIATNDLIRVYNPTAGFANSVYFLAVVSSVNSTAIVINKSFTNSAVLGTGFVADKLNNKNTVWRDNQNANVATYYNSTMSAYTKYSTFAIKILLTSSNTYVVPKIQKLRAIGVSA